ncbi:MAG TPA: hypothetical protein DCP28_16340 [Cytophagales bacterium]|nr:hypothetical protein [Cytophagales bacterium]
MREINFLGVLLFLLNLTSISVGQIPAAVAESPSLGLNPEKRLTQYLVRNWTVEEGLPRNNVLDGTQTTDGYIWFGGFAGLVRFDGVEFQVFNSQSDSVFNADGVYTLHADAQNRLWIGTQGSGLLRYAQGQFQQLFTDTLLQQASVFAMAPDANGSMWLSTSRGLLHYSETGITVPDSLESIASKRIRELLIDSQGILWIGTSNEGLYRYGDEQLTFVGVEDGLPSEAIYSLSEGIDGHMWVGTWNGLARLSREGEVLSVQQNSPGQPTRSLDASLIDQHGTLWVGGLEGLGRYHQGEWKQFESRVGFQLKEISTLFQDQQGTLWAGTYRHGIWQITDGRFSGYSIPEGLSGGVVYALLAEEDAVYIGTETGLSVLTSEGVKDYLQGEGSQHFVRDIQRDSRGQLWLCTYGGLVAWDGYEKKRYTTQNGFNTNQIRTLAEDTEGNLWVGTRVGLFQIAGDSVVIPPEVAELSQTYILSLFSDSRGHLWIGTNGSGLYRWDGQKLLHYTQADGLGNNFIFRLEEDETGTLWIGTTGGLTRYQKGQFATLTRSHGLPSNVAFQPLVDDFQRLWVITDANVWMSPLREVNRLLDDKVEQLAGLQTFDKYDGLLGGQPTGVSVSHIGPDNRLYVCTPLGFSTIDLKTDHVYRHTPMQIDRVQSDARDYQGGGPVVVSPGNRQLIIHYTAFDYYAPQALRFSYQLEGFDSEWVEAGGRRGAIYTNLPPGEYTFRLKVASHDGEWSEEPLTMTIEQEAWFYQTDGFKFLVFFLFIGVGVIIHYSRIRLLEAHNKRLSQLVTKRTHMIEKQKEAIAGQAKMLESSYVKINDSIQYARRIQDALLPSPQSLQHIFPESFILYRPKDVVSGDFYWFEQIGQTVVLAVVDCTGHGIPGAFMSVLGNTLLTQIVSQQGILHPKAILRELHLQTIMHLQQDDHSDQMQDGMDVSLVMMDFEKKTLSFAGAKRPLLYHDGLDFHVLKGDRYSIGSVDTQLHQEFKEHTLPLSQIRQVYLFSDGYADQFGGEKGRKFMTKKFYSLLDQLSEKPWKAQLQELETTWLDWRGQQEQVDDILVVGVSLS